jgi:Tfp pilus assembly protein PilV
MAGEVTMPALRRPADRAIGGGFTILEIMIALTILLIGIAGLLTMQMSALRANSFSRHATEATVLAQDKMEALRTEGVATLAAGSDQVDARGVPSTKGLFFRSWTPTVGIDGTSLVVRVTWAEKGTETSTITVRTVRN